LNTNCIVSSIPTSRIELSPTTLAFKAFIRDTTKIKTKGETLISPLFLSFRQQNTLKKLNKNYTLKQSQYYINIIGVKVFDRLLKSTNCLSVLVSQNCHTKKTINNPLKNIH